MTAITALEIFGNPKDLIFSIGYDDQRESYYFIISRGPGHNGRMILSGEGIPDRNAVIDLIRIILDAVMKCGLENLPIFGGKAEECLTEDQKENILKTLAKKSVCSNCPLDLSLN